MSENLEKTEKNLRDLIETLRDGHQGFIELEKNLKDPAFADPTKPLIAEWNAIFGYGDNGQ